MPISARKRLSQPFRKFVTCGGKQLKSRTPQRRFDSWVMTTLACAKNSRAKRVKKDGGICGKNRGRGVNSNLPATPKSVNLFSSDELDQQHQWLHAKHVQLGFPRCFAPSLPANAHSDIGATKTIDLRMMRQQQHYSCLGHATRQLSCDRESTERNKGSWSGDSCSRGLA
jgi:hypothetical protein